mmetsp:Transcript_13447/g.31837  ORF Transcript_13447/g.31837 Transcript_13447/m.31837 type:complete len:330 (+) Transcript_13447:156-1145(+)
MGTRRKTGKSPTTEIERGKGVLRAPDTGASIERVRGEVVQRAPRLDGLDEQVPVFDRLGGEHFLFGHLRLLGRDGLDAGHDDGLHNVLDRAAPAQVVDGELEALHHWADRHTAARLLHGLVRVVAGVEVGEDADVCPPGDGAGAPAELDLGHHRVHRRIKLDRALDRVPPIHDQRVPPQELRRLPDLGDHRAGVAVAGGIAQHGDPRAQAKARRGDGAGRADLGELLGCGRLDDGAVGKHLHAAVEQHEEGAAHHVCARRALDHLQRRPHRVRRRVDGAADHPIRGAPRHHHRAKHVGVRPQQLQRPLRRHPLAPPEAAELLGHLIEVG